jgi:hypothetical protein
MFKFISTLFILEKMVNIAHKSMQTYKEYQLAEKAKEETEKIKEQKERNRNRNVYARKEDVFPNNK